MVNSSQELQFSDIAYTFYRIKHGALTQDSSPIENGQFLMTGAEKLKGFNCCMMIYPPQQSVNGVWYVLPSKNYK